MSKKKPSKKINVNDIPMDPNIAPRDWKIGVVKSKKKDALKATCDAEEIDYSSGDGRSELIEYLVTHKKNDAKDHKKEIARQRAAAKKEKAKKSRTSRNKRKVTDPIRSKPPALNVNDFNMVFEPQSANNMMSAASGNKETIVNIQSFMHENDEHIEKVKEVANGDDSKELQADDADEIIADNAEEPKGDDREEIDGEDIENQLRTIGLKEDQIDILISLDFECIIDVLNISEKDLSKVGFKLGAIKAIQRKFGAEKIKRGMAKAINSDPNANDTQDINKASMFNQLLNALKENNSQNNSKNNVKDQDDSKKVWYKIGGRNRKCYVGDLKSSEIRKYKAIIVRVGITSACTQASEYRTEVFGVTRSGSMNKVRCCYDEDTKTWPYSNIVIVEKTLGFLCDMRFMEIFEEGRRHNDYYARFGRNRISTAVALQASMDKMKEFHTWMKALREDVDWDKYMRETYDNVATRFRLCDFSNIGPDWDGFQAWVNSKPDLKIATDPNEI